MHADQNGYSQPADYRFSHDSIELAQRAAVHLKTRSIVEGVVTASSFRVLDLCAGCGVVGLELARLVPELRALDFVEVQSIYHAHFKKNVEWVGGALEARWLEMNYSELLGFVSSSYNLVVSNPPYFDREQGNLPPSDFKARCRFFLDSDFETLWHSIAHVLKPGGEAFVLVRDIAAHGVDRAATLDRILAPFGEWRLLESIRGTGLVYFHRRDKPIAVDVGTA